MKRFIAISVIIVGIASIVAPAQAMVEHVLVRLDPPRLRDPLVFSLPNVVVGAPPFTQLVIPVGSGVDP